MAKQAAHQLTNGDQTGGHCKLPQTGPYSSTQAESLRALKQSLSLRMDAQAGSVRATLEPAMPGVACQQVMGVQSLSLGAEIQESTTTQHRQQRRERTPKYNELPTKRSRFTQGYDGERDPAHAITVHVFHECDRARKKRNKVDKNQALYPINRIEESAIQSGLPTEGASLQEESVEVKLPNLKKMTAVQEKAQDLLLLHLSDGKEYSNTQSGPSQETLFNFDMQPPSRNITEEPVIVPPKEKKRGEKKAKRRHLRCNTKGEDTTALSGLLNEDGPGQGGLATRKEVIAKVERAATKAHNKLLAEGGAVTVVKVVLELVRDSNNVSLESLGLSIHEIPHLRQLAYVEERVNTLILCHLAARKITTLYDLHQEISIVEKVKNFSKLQIGHLSMHPLVVQHFASSSGFKIYNITANDVLNHLWDYLDIDTHQNPSKLQVDDFLSFMVKARSLSSPDQLCVRIQSLERYAAYFLREKKAVVKLLNRVCKSNETVITRKVQKRGFKMHCHSTHSRTIQHSKHVVYLSSDKEDDNNHKWVELAGKKEDSLTSDGLLDKRCLYPSAAEERIRLLGKVPSQLRQELTECELSVQEIQAIVTAWSDVCSSFSIEEALMQMFMENGLEQEISKKQLLMLFKRHSATTILNVVVKSMKAGLWKSVLDTEKDPISNEMLNNDVTKSSNKEIFLRSSTEQTDKEELGFSSTCEEQPVRSLEQVLDVVVRVLHEVLMSVASTLNVCRPGQGMPNGQSFCFMLKNILTFEKDVVERLSLESFCKLKMGPFQTFIDMHLNKILKDCSKMCKSTALSVMCGMVVSDEGAQTFVSQVRKAVGIGEHLSHEFLMHLFAKQFQLQVLSGWWSIIIQDIADSPVCGNASSYSVLFSSALLASKRDCEDSLNGDVINDEDAVQICIRPQVGLLGSISSADARHCLLNAPMLCNLLRWSQWDSVFFPTLGLFPDWLKKEGPVEGLVCLVTSNGIYLRIDGSATIEKFLAAAVKGCGKQAAVQFVSVVAAYGGVDRVPLEVLKLYSQQAVEVLIGKSRLDFIAKTVATGYLEAIQGSSQGELISKWRQFFENLGVLDFVKVKCNSRKLHDKADVFWKRLPEHIKNESSLSVEDWECPELIEIVEGLCDACCDTPNKLKKLSDFVAAFDSLWDECYSKYSASCSEKEGLRVNVLPSFVLKLRSYAWVQSSFDGKLYKPTQLYHRCAAVESILGVHAPYAVPQMSSVRFAEALGLKMNVSVLDVLNVLTMWNQHSFKTSLSQMEKLYSFLRKETAQSEKDVRAFFQQNACIFVPDKIRASSKTRCKGRFYFVYELIWKDDSGCLAKLLHSSSDVSNLKICPKTLDLLYPTLRDFLVDVCQVKHTMEIGDYVNVLRMFAKQFSPSEVVTEVLAVFSKWSLDIDNRKLSFSALCKLKEVLHSKDSPILPTTQNKWVSLHSSEWLVCWCDDDVIGRQFSNSKIFYVCVGTSSAKGLIEAEVNSQIGQLLPFFKAMDILPLSKVVQQQPTICGAKWGKQIFDMLNWSFPYTQRYLRRWHRDIYKSLEQSSFDIRLRKIECFHTEKLSFCYRLPRNLGLGTEQLEVDYLLQGEKFYGTNVKNLKALYLEFSKIYFDGTSDMKLADFLHLIASAFQSGSDVTELESLLTWEGIGPCSDLDKEWRLKSSSENKAQLETGSLKHSADHHVKEKESNQVQDLANNRINDKCHRSAVDNVAVCKRSLAVLMNQGGAEQHAKKKESKKVQVKLSQNLAKNRMDDKCHSSAVDNVAVCKRSLAAPMNQGGAEQHAKQKESKQVQEKLSQDLPSNIIDDKCHSAAVDSVAVCKRSLAALMNQGEPKELEATGKRSRSSSTTKVAPPVIESGLGHSGKKSEVLKYADDVVALQADGRGAKVCEIDPCKNKNDKVGGPCVITNFPSDSSLAGLKVQRDRCDNKPQFVSLSRKDQIFFGDPCKEQAFLTGRLGEAVVFNHLMENYGTNRVLWINEEMERGFPYDIAVEESDGQQLHVEVKATWSENKDWFEISNQEWEFAAHACDKYIIVRVFFSRSSGSARFVWLRNPVKLCQDKRVRLALIVPS